MREASVLERPLKEQELLIGVPDVLAVMGHDPSSPEVTARVEAAAEYLASCNLNELLERSQHVQQLYSKVTTRWGEQQGLRLTHVDLFGNVLLLALESQGSKEALNTRDAVKQTRRVVSAQQGLSR